MNALTLYAIVASSIFIAFFLTRALTLLIGWTNLIAVFVSRHLSLLVHSVCKTFSLKIYSGVSWVSKLVLVY